MDNNPFPAMVDLNVIDIDLNVLPSMQAQGVSWETITANHLFNDLVGRGILRFPFFCDEGLERFCRWHLTDLHTTDRCPIFRNFLIKLQTRGTFVLTREQVSAMVGFFDSKGKGEASSV